MRNHIKTLTLAAIIACAGCSKESNEMINTKVNNATQTNENTKSTNINQYSQTPTYTFQGPTVQEVYETYNIPNKDKQDVQTLHTLYKNGQISQDTFNTILKEEYNTK